MKLSWNVPPVALMTVISCFSFSSAVPACVRVIWMFPTISVGVNGASVFALRLRLTVSLPSPPSQ